MLLVIQLRKYSGTPLMWTLWGPSQVSCVEDTIEMQWNPSNVDTLGTWSSVLYRGHH